MNNYDKGKLAERQGRKAIGSKVQMHDDSLAAKLNCVLNLQNFLLSIEHRNMVSFFFLN